MPILEKMSDFFAARVQGYDTHMLQNVQGCREGYTEMAKRLPEGTKTLLDLGCGTGLELDEIFRRFPSLRVTGIDLTSEMLEELHRKHPDKALTLRCEDYFAADLGKEVFDAAVSFESLHHFTKEMKQKLYQKVFDALKPGGVYIECDYMARDDEEEAALFAECARLRQEQMLPEDVFYHFDTPCTVENQKKLLNGASFATVTEIFRISGTVMLIAQKQA